MPLPETGPRQSLSVDQQQKFADVVHDRHTSDEYAEAYLVAREEVHDLTTALLAGKIDRSVFEHIIGARVAALTVESTVDQLTLIPNELAFKTRLEETIALAQRNGHTVSVAYVDLDEFKSINDNHGHDVGDRFLAEFGRYAQGDIRRGGDYIARLHGDEFAVIFYGSTPEQAAQALERIRQPVPILVPRRVATALKKPELASQSLGLSIGIASADYSKEFVPADALLRNADVAVLGAKQFGRDRCTIRNSNGTITDTQTGSIYTVSSIGTRDRRQRYTYTKIKPR